MGSAAECEYFRVGDRPRFAKYRVQRLVRNELECEKRRRSLYTAVNRAHDAGVVYRSHDNRPQRFGEFRHLFREQIDFERFDDGKAFAVRIV